MSTHERADKNQENNVTYQRCFFAYEFIKDRIINKSVIDIGCGEAYGTNWMAQFASSVIGVDYDSETIKKNQLKYTESKNLRFVQSVIPPLNFPDEHVDVVTAFQFIEHIKERKAFVKEAFRILKKGGCLIITTPNIKKSLARNPFHVHEYTFDEIKKELADVSTNISLLGLKGDKTVEEYYTENSKWVRKILKWDFLNLHKMLPASLLFKPYNFITNLMRKDLMKANKQTTQISTANFFIDTTALDESLDIYAIITK